MVEGESIELPKQGKLTFFEGSQMANPRILGLIPLSQIRKVLRRVGPQIVKLPIFINNSLIPKLLFKKQQNSVSKHLRIFGRFKSANKIKDRVCRVIFAEGSQIQKIFKVHFGFAICRTYLRTVHLLRVTPPASFTPEPKFLNC